MSRTVIYFCGPHCSGKTTILQRLLEEKVLDFRGDEIGKDFFYREALSTEEQGEAFEFKVTARELSRDRVLKHRGGRIGIETWHPGNLAYAAVRNPACVPALCSEMRTSPLLSEAIGIRFTLSPDRIYARTKTFAENRDWAANFYARIDAVLDDGIAMLRLQDRTLRVDADRPLDCVYADVKRIIEGMKG